MRRPIWALATLASFVAIALAIVSAQQSPRQSPLSLSIHVPVPPTAVLTDGTWRLLYELHIENRGDAAVTLTNLEIRATSPTSPQAAAIVLDGERLIQALDAPADRGAPLAIPARARRVAYIDVGEKTPPRVMSHVIRTAATDGAAGEITLDVPVDQTPPVILGAPLAGGPYAAVYHSDWARGHRRVFYTVDGVTRLPGRHTIDFVKLDDEGRTTRPDGNADAVADSLGYGVDVFAVSDATVAAVRDDMPEAERVSPNVKHRQEDAAGNYISLDLGGGRFAVYEHLKPASIRVRPGQRVRRGDIIGQLGFTGDSTGPHLHLHIGDAASPLAAEGRAFVFDRFATLGRYTDISAMGKSRWQTEGTTLRERERPGPNVIVDFGAIPAAGAPTYREPLRPQFHFTPASNFMNDPNGLVFYKGEYHLFYQHNPLGRAWGHMSWGHAVSKDLLHWEHLPLALSEENGIMIFSGSAVVDHRNTSGFCQPRDGDSSCLVAIYTGHEKNRQTQHLAYSNDRGRTWTKYAGNPVIDLGLKDFRDPKVFWHAPTARWIMVTVLSDQRKVRFFGSADLKHWEALSDFGPAGATGGVWECPDLFPLEVEGEPGNIRWVLDVDINPGAIAGGSGGQYFVGTFDGRTFVNDNASGHTMWADYGKDFYATISFSDIPPSDGRRIWMAWISNWAYANVEPTEAWRGAQSIPRQLALRRLPAGLRLVQKPIDELTSLREKTEPIAIEKDSSMAVPASGAFELRMEVRRGTWQQAGQQAGIRLFNAAGEEVTIGINSKPLELFVNREKSRAGTMFHKDYAGRHSGPLRWRDDRVTLHVFFDRSVIEVFANDGEMVITDRVYPSQPFDRVQLLTGSQTATAATARLWPLRSTWPTH
jgi:sucrose-6-phosphate hydrolase SacC (GH32 family)/murein DD-endopeptidase MepM/ murein hydrolase activator NlpD